MVKNEGELGKLEMPNGFYGWYAKFNVGSLCNFQLVLVGYARTNIALYCHNCWPVLL